MKEFATRFYVAMHNQSGSLVSGPNGSVLIDTNRTKVRGEALDASGPKQFTILALDAVDDSAVYRAQQRAWAAKKRAASRERGARG